MLNRARPVAIAVFIFGLADAALGQTPSGGSRTHPSGHRPEVVAKQRAQAAWEALERWFGNSGAAYPGIFATLLPGPNGEVQPNYVWGQGEVVHAALNLARITDDYSAFLRTAPTLSRYLLTNKGTTGFAPPVDAGKSSDPPIRWWDDNGITGLVLLQAYAQRDETSYLQTVQNIWPFFKAGQWPAGGQRENESTGFQLIGTVPTSSDGETAEHLYLLTSPADPQHAEYLKFALANDAVVKAKLRAPGDLYWDSYYPDVQNAQYKWCDGTVSNGACSGTWWACKPDRSDLPPPQLPPTPNVCAWTWPHNQGLMVGSDVLLYRITGDPSFLQSAIRTANAALAFYTPDWLWVIDPWDNLEYFLGLFQLDTYAPDPRIRTSLEAYLDRAWNEGRDPATGLFNRGGIGVYQPKVGISSLDQASFVTMYSLLAWPRLALPDAY
jgi:hypothetical protein